MTLGKYSKCVTLCVYLLSFMLNHKTALFMVDHAALCVTQCNVSQLKKAQSTKFSALQKELHIAADILQLSAFRWCWQAGTKLLTITKAFERDILSCLIKDSSNVNSKYSLTMIINNSDCRENISVLQIMPYFPIFFNVRGCALSPLLPTPMWALKCNKRLTRLPLSSHYRPVRLRL